jgi:hypothetical protein
LTTETVTINPSLNRRLEDIKAKVFSKYTIKHLLATGDNVQTIIDYLTSKAFSNITDFGYKCRSCGTINRITLEDGEPKKHE